MEKLRKMNSQRWAKKLTEWQPPHNTGKEDERNDRKGISRNLQDEA